MLLSKLFQENLLYDIPPHVLLLHPCPPNRSSVPVEGILICTVHTVFI
jgi:hypothetical protein